MGGMGGMGPGMGPGMGRSERWGPDVTPGWAMMSEEERRAHMTQMQGARTRQECQKLMEQQHALMAQRARERGVTMPAGPGPGACQGLPPG